MSGGVANSIRINSNELLIAVSDNKFYWTVDDEVNGIEWEEIPESLYWELVNFNENKL
tara:strand:- start:5041 stop:5214 length:174 start_codon:yes stop_codon:yes gene_type:complete